MAGRSSAQTPRDLGSRRDKPGPRLVIGLLALITFGMYVFSPFDESQRVSGRRIAGLSRIKQLGTGILIYTTDFGDHFPPAMASAQSFRSAVLPLVKAPEIFKSLNPQGGEILGDRRLGGRRVTAVENPKLAVMLFDRLPWPNGSSPVYRVDGSAKTRPHETIAALMAPDPFGGLTVAEERRQKRKRMSAPSPRRGDDR